jgi:hypothetical protein
MKLKLHIHKQGFTSKPEGKIIGAISNEITNSTMEVEPEQLAQIMGAGHTAVLATMNGKRKAFNMEQQQVLMLDFDNKDENKQMTQGMFYTSIEEILADPFIQENASFLYKTFSHADGWDKFRVAFVLDKSLKTLEEVYGAYQYLLDKYPNADKACKDPSRIFFGGTEYIEINFANVLETADLPKEVVEKPKAPKIELVADSQVEKARKAKPVFEHGDGWTHTLMRKGMKDAVKARLSVYGCKLPSKVMAVNYLKTLNMMDVFGVKMLPFYDFFHKESNPSAGMFKLEGTDIWLYKCHSEGADSTPMDIVRLTSKILNVSYTQALNYLIEVTGIEIEVTEQIKELREQCDLFMNLLTSDDIQATYPAIHERFWRYKAQIVTLLTIFKENIYEDENGALRSLTWMSVRTLAKKVYGKESSYNTMSQLLNLLTLTNWIDKLDDSQIPAPLLEKLKHTQQHYTTKGGKSFKRDNEREHRSNVFELLTLGDDFFTQLNSQCEVMKQQGFTMKGLSREYILRTHGKELADKLYPQDTARTISKVSDAITTDIHKIALKQIEKYGYVIEVELLEKVQKKWKSKGFTEKKYKQAVSELLDMYGLQRKRLNKELKEEFGLTKHFNAKQSPTILMKAV